jgi:hypothetical protein
MRLSALLLLALSCYAQVSPPVAKQAAPAQTNPDTPAEPAAARTQLNLLGQTDASSGESRRNENVQFNLIDNNALKELNIRLGVTATFISVFDVSRNYFGSEYGTPPPTPLGLALALKKDWHGNLYWNHQNSIFSARSFFQVGSVLPARDNDYGFSVGGRIWRNASLSLDGSQKRLRGNVNGNVLVPLTTERTPLATEPRLRDYVQKIIDSYPAQAPNRTDIDPRMLNTNSAQSIDNDALSGRLDQRLGSKDNLVLRHAYLTQKVQAFQLVRGQNPDTTTRSNKSVISWSRAWSPATVTSLSAGFERVRTLIVPEPNNLGPQIFISSALTSINPQNAVPIDRVQNQFRYSGQWRRSSGNHQFSAGFELLRRQFNGYEGDSQLGALSFNNNFGNDALTNLRLGLATYFYGSVAIQPLRRGFRSWDNYFYAGDTWKLHRRLTWSYGLHYRLNTRPREVNRMNEFTYKQDNNNIGPTMGLAWQGTSSFVFRAAYGLHYGEVFPVTLQQIRFNAPNNVKVVLPNPNILNPLESLPADLTKAGRTVLYAFAPDLSTPYAHQYSALLEFRLRAGWKLETGYVGSRALKLLQRWHVNRGAIVPGIPLTTATLDDRRANSRYGDVRYITSSSRAYYDAWRTTFSVAQWRGLSLESSYWLSKSLDTGSSYTNTAYDTDAFTSRSQSEDLGHADLKSLSDFDQKHALLLRGSYTFPIRSKRLGAWSLNSVFLAKTGTPFNLRSGSDAPGFGNVDGVSGDRPDLIDPSILGRSIGSPDTSRQLLPREAFAFFPAGRERGNVGRNVFRRGGIRNLNAGLSADWGLPEDLKLNFRAESINLSNTPQFAEPGTALTDPNFGVITNTLNDGRAFRFLLRLSF